MQGKHSFLIILLLLCTTQAIADAYQEGFKAYQLGDYPLARTLWLPLTEQGNPKAQYSLGLMYEQGQGVAQNRLKAMNFYLQAAENGLALAQHRVGKAFLLGDLTGKDYVQAADWLNRAAEQNIPDAEYLLGTMANEGLGQPRNYPKANRWFTRAAKAGHSSAQHSLAMNYILGQGTDKDLRQGILWLDKAGRQGNLDAMRDLGFFYYQGLGVNQDLKKAALLLNPPATAGSPLAQFLLGEIYRRGGDGIARDATQANYWYQLADKNGYPDAGKRLALPAQQVTREGRQSAPVKPQSDAFQQQLAKHRRYLKSLPGHYYTLQLAQVKSAQSLSRVIALSQSYPALFFIKVYKQQEPWYVIAYGNYPSVKAAKQHLADIPGPLKNGEPWIRPISQIQAML